MSIEEDLKDRDLWADGFQTRGGKPVRILCIDSGNDRYPVVALRQSANGQWQSTMYASDGCLYVNCGDSSFDLIRRPVKRKGALSGIMGPAREPIEP